MKSADVRIKAATALGRVGARAGVEALLEHLPTESGDVVRVAVVQALGQVRDRRVIAPFYRP